MNTERYHKEVNSLRLDEQKKQAWIAELSENPPVRMTPTRITVLICLRAVPAIPPACRSRMGSLGGICRRCCAFCCWFGIRLAASRRTGYSGRRRMGILRRSGRHHATFAFLGSQHGPHHDAR